MREEGVELRTHLGVDPLGVGLPAGHRLEPGRPLERHRLGEAAVDDQRRLIDLQGDGRPLFGGHPVLLA